jgi:PKD repeat protein
VTDDQGATGSKSITITVDLAVNTPPVAMLTAAPTAGTVPLTVAFSSAGSHDADGTIASQVWDFGNGTRLGGAEVSHTYTTAGTFTATLTVTDDKGATDVTSVVITVAGAPVNRPPVAAVEAVPTSGTAPLNVSFSGAGSADPDGTVASYAWNFGDGVTSSAVNPSHVYSLEGSYVATLIVTDDKGATDSKVIVITVSPAPPNTPPVAAASGTPTSGIAPLTVTFSSAGSADADGAIGSYLWTFGTGAASSEPNPTYVYTLPGLYLARLTVTDDKGLSDSREVPIQVSPPPQTSSVMFVSNVGLELLRVTTAIVGKASVTVLDGNGAPVPNVIVTGRWFGVISTPYVFALTDANGQATFLSKNLFLPTGALGFTVTDVQRQGMTYDPAKNLKVIATASW